MLLAVLAIAICFIVGITFVSTSTPTVAASHLLGEHAQARQIAESGLNAVVGYIERSPDWRTTQAEGVWIPSQALFGGSLKVSAKFFPEIPSPSAADPSFETAVSSLPTPLLNPPMSGTIGGWQVRRTAVLQTGPTVPTIGTQVDPGATDGANVGFVSFGASVVGSGTFSQDLGAALSPRTRYELSADITVTSGLSDLDYGLRVLAGSAVVASSNTAWSLQLPPDPGAAPDPPEDPADPGQYQGYLTYVGVSPGSPGTFTLSFITDNDPPPGNIVIELYTQATSLAASVRFDNVRFVARRNDAVTLTATGTFKDAGHMVRADVVKGFDGKGTIVNWTEP